MNLQLITHIENELLQVLGKLTFVENDSHELQSAKGQLRGMIHGLRIVRENCEKYPMTEKELKDEFTIRREATLK